MTSQIGYLKLLITRSILSGPQDFEIESRLYLFVYFIYLFIYFYLFWYIYFIYLFIYLFLIVFIYLHMGHRLTIGTLQQNMKI